MKLDFNKWPFYLAVFAPIVIWETFNIVANISKMPFGVEFAISSVLFIPSILICYAAQFYVGLEFYRQSRQQKLFFIVVSTVALLYLIYFLGFIIYNFHNYTKMDHAVNRPQKPGLNEIIFYWFAWYITITYLLINNNIIRWNIRKIQDKALNADLKLKYLLPLKMIVRISAALYFTAMIISMIMDYKPHH